jgi:hypothetical protein
MNVDTSALVSVATAAGFGGIIGAYFQARFQRRNQLNEHEHDLRQKRYLCTLVLMLSRLNPDTGLVKLRRYRPDVATLAELDAELSTELFHAIIFASKPVITSLARFNRNPSDEGFVTTVNAMRADLWGRGGVPSSELLDVLREASKTLDSSATAALMER